MRQNEREERILAPKLLTPSYTARAVLLWNLIYALLNGVIGIHFHSYWFISIAAWYLILGLLRILLVCGNHSRGKQKAAGVGICFLAVVLSGIVCMGIAEQHNPVRNLIVMITLATYTFTFFTAAVINAVKAHRQREILPVIRRDVSMVSSLGSLLALERGMLGTFGEPSSRFALIMEAATGAVVFLLILMIGISLMARGLNKA